MSKDERLPVHSIKPGDELDEDMLACIVCGDETRHMCHRCYKAICIADDLDSKCHVPMHPVVAPRRSSRWWLNHDNN